MYRDIDTGRSKAADKKVSLRYLFTAFFKIGLVSFGGHMALISVVQREMVDKDNVIDNDTILGAVTVASLLPGPLAVNVVTYIGHFLRGKKGAAISMLGILLPACILMFILSVAYFRYAYSLQAGSIMYFTGATVGAIIISTGLNLFRKEAASDVRKSALSIIAVIIQFISKSYFITIGLIIAGGLAGVIMKTAGVRPGIKESPGLRMSLRMDLPAKLMLTILAICELSFIANIPRLIENTYLKIGLVFSGISLSLFGGGYVMIPIMQSLFVNEMKWLSTQEFIDAIAFSQVTPGPILVSATFIGYKLAGITGAILATMSIFIPSAVLMIFVSQILDKNKDNKRLRHVLAGIKAIVIGLIIASGLKLLQQLDRNVVVASVAILSFLLNYKYKVSPVYLILASIAAGVILKIVLY
ncbi:chromate transporter [Arcticibacter tournemirensis]|uniref:Chromate efflux transporter n=1 Tax=Arcticibacter tournemirensis TaxID=699437 RepID=A0A5M9HDA1_9SPHI|nr:chromate efflux transporter [Arcticibacter tournemirensis]KAA8484956.1 chromate efflux transporter [Arcticibacter tournemirensis]TQM50603.1 chromate transporter [Arcticibacter tournemirensis]